MEDKNLKQAQAVYKTFCDMLDGRNWHYKKDDEKLEIKCGAQGDDLPMELKIMVDSKRLLIAIYSFMPFEVPESRRKEMAVAVARANYGMVDGSFDYDYNTGKIVFRITSSYRDSLVGKDMCEYLLMCACFTIDRYNDKFLVISKNDMTIDEIIKFIE